MWLILIIYIFTVFSFFTVRLVNGPTSYEGRVEVHHNGEWGRVCDDGWDLNDAQVVCNQLGLDKAVAIRPGTFNGQSTGRIWLSKLNCAGNELTIENCSHTEWGVGNCSHSEDAAVKCLIGNFLAFHLL